MKIQPKRPFAPTRRGFTTGVAAGGLLAAAGGFGLPRAARAATPIQYATWSAAVDLVGDHVRRFEEHHGLEVNYMTSAWAEYRESMVTRFIGGAPLDVCWVADNWLPEWAEAGWLAPIDEIDDLVRYNDDVEQFCTDAASYNGRQYGLTYYADHMAFMYDEKMLEAAGISAPPTTWDEVTEQSLIIKEAGLAEYPVMLALAQETWLIEFLAAMVYSHGGRFAGADNEPVMHIPGEGAVETLQWIVDAINEHGIISRNQLDIGELLGLRAFSSGQHAFALEPAYRIRMLNDPAQSEVAGNIRMALMPRGNGHDRAETVGWTRFFGMSAQAAADPARAEAAAKLIEWFGGMDDTGYTFQKNLLLNIGPPFCTTPLQSDPDVLAHYDRWAGGIAVYSEQFSFARTKEIIQPWFGAWDSRNGALWQSAVLGERTPVEALEESARVWSRLRDDWG
jgi:multiple sugar transport system substrate-binding protein